MSRKSAVFALVLPTLILLASPPVFAADASGFVRAEGCTYFRGYGMYLQRVDGRKAANSHRIQNSAVVLLGKLGERMEQCGDGRVFRLQSVRDGDRGKDQDPTRSAAFFPPPAHHTWPFGDFAIELKNGKKLEGSFAEMTPHRIIEEGIFLSLHDHTRPELFSFGAVLYEMATGMLPFRGNTSGLILWLHLSRLQRDDPVNVEVEC